MNFRAIDPEAHPSTPGVALSAPIPAQHPGAMLARRAAFERAGPFDETLRLAEVVASYVRAEAAGVRFAMLPEVVLYRRIHDENQGIRKRDALVEYVRVPKARLDLRRAASDGGGR